MTTLEDISKDELIKVTLRLHAEKNRLTIQLAEAESNLSKATGRTSQLRGRLENALSALALYDDNTKDLNERLDIVTLQRDRFKSLWSGAVSREPIEYEIGAGELLHTLSLSPDALAQVGDLID
jgi:predicted  nucleic acid-binding Zn-ribbon protein